MFFLKLFGEQLKKVAIDPNATRSSSLIEPIHSAIADQVELYGFTTKSLRNKEYNFVGPYGEKKVDIAIFKNKKLVGVIMFKGIRSEYNKNANNYFENMRGESQLFIDGNIPVYELILIPTKVKHKKSNGELVFETPAENHRINYNNYINSSYKPTKVKVGIYYVEVNYNTYDVQYSNIKIPNIENTIEEGIKNFCILLGEE